MKPFSLEEYLKNPKRKVITRTGKNARIRCTDVKKELYPVLALVDIGDYESPALYTADGEFILGQERDFDLFFASEKHEGWINIFRGKDSPFTGNIIFTSKEEAEESGRHCCGFTKDLYMTSAKIEWEE